MTSSRSLIDLDRALAKGIPIDDDIKRAFMMLVCRLVQKLCSHMIETRRH